MPGSLVGKVTRYYSRIGVAAITLEAPLSIGDSIHLLGHTTDFDQTVESMELDNRQVIASDAGDEIAIKVPQKVRVGDNVCIQAREEG